MAMTQNQNQDGQGAAADAFRPASDPWLDRTPTAPATGPLQEPVGSGGTGIHGIPEGIEERGERPFRAPESVA